MKKGQKSRHTWYILIPPGEQRRSLFIKQPSLEKEFKSLPEEGGGRVLVIRAGAHHNIAKRLRSFSEAIGICAKNRARPWDRLIGHEIYVRRSPIAPLARFPKRKREK